MLFILEFLGVYATKVDREKFDAKARKCVKLEYGTETKAYQLYDLERKKVFFSQDVLFDELRSGIDDDSQPQKSESETKVIQLDCLSEDEAACRRRTSPTNSGNWLTFGEVYKAKKSARFLCEDKDQCIDTMDKEIESLKVYEVWNLVEPPIGSNTVDSK